MNRAVIGLQWGDEAKGKIVDYLSRNVNLVIRYQGGPNAGHTVKIKEKEIIFHHLPSGLLHPHVKGVIGMGCVVDPEVLVHEIKSMENIGINLHGRLTISGNAHLILPYHKIMDRLREEKMNKIGTTKKGIGPAYEDKYGRTGILMKDLLDRDKFFKKIKKILPLKNFIIMEMYNGEPVSESLIKDLYETAHTELKEFIGSGIETVWESIMKGEEIIFEGAQGTHLDIGVGTYPFVTSSHPVSSGIGTGIGIYTQIHLITGVMKAYTTRVGEGPMPTEMKNEEAEIIRKKGNEYGATTGRPRRCGWLDLPLLKFSIKANKIDELAITKIDVLDDMESIKVCTGYIWKNKEYKEYIPEIMDMDEVEPVYIEIDGWKSKTHGVKDYEELPEKAKHYIEFIEKELNVPVRYISTGPERKEIIVR